MNKVLFMNNHGHTEMSNFRNKDCIIRTADYVDKAIEYGMNGCSITDHEALTGHVQFLQRYLFLKKLREKYEEYLVEDNIEAAKEDSDFKGVLHLMEKMPLDFKVGLGNEIYLMSQEELKEAKENYNKDITRYWHFVLIAKDLEGYQQLKEISSESAWKNYSREVGQERVPTIMEELEEIIGENKGHLIASTACLGSKLANLALKYFYDGDIEVKKKIHSFIKWMIRVFGKENVFIEIQPCINIKKDLRELEDSEVPEQVKADRGLMTLAKAYDLNAQVTCDSHYLRPEHINILDAFLNSDENGKSERETAEFYSSAFLWKPEELKNNLKLFLSEEEVRKVFEGTQKVHSMIEDYNIFHDVIIPEDKHIPFDVKVKHIFKPYYDDYEYIKLFAESKHPQDREFLRLIENGFEKFNQEFSETNLARINTELGTLWQISEMLNQKLSSYYVLVRNIVHEIMWKVSYVGPARGSVTGFYTAFLSEIIQVNPLEYDLPEWRHIHPQRPELPDIDLDSESSKRPLIFEGMKEYFGRSNVLNTLTLKTEGSKSTCLTVLRGLGIDNDIAQVMADMIPFERGANWPFRDCFEGNEEKGRSPVTEFINMVAQYDGLKEMLLMIEGLVSGRSIHASATYIFTDGYLKQNARMKAPNGIDITAFNMTDSDALSGLKMDTLTVSALDKIHTCVDLLIANGRLEDKGSIKDNYFAYLDPRKLDYDTPEMWKMLGDNALIDAFQMDTPQGRVATKLIKPKSLKELAISNSLMRLMAEDGEQPMEVYAKYKKDIKLWYSEMEQYGLNKEEIALMKKYLESDYGVSAEQESVMEMTMDEQIAGFSVKEANKLRKSIAKFLAS